MLACRSNEAIQGSIHLFRVQDAGGVTVGTSQRKAGAINAALLATAILGNKHPKFREMLAAFRATQTQTVLDQPDPAATG